MVTLHADPRLASTQAPLPDGWSGALWLYRVGPLVIVELRSATPPSTDAVRVTWPPGYKPAGSPQGALIRAGALAGSMQLHVSGDLLIRPNIASHGIGGNLIGMTIEAWPT